MIEINTTKTRRRKGCLRAARHRARMASRAGRSRTVALLVFLWAFLTGPYGATAASGMRPILPSSALPAGETRLVNDYERGLGGDHCVSHRRSQGLGRYRGVPSIARLLRDLRRTAACEDATKILLSRIPDPVTRQWVRERILASEVNRLAVWVRPGTDDREVFKAWRSEADSDHLDQLNDDGQPPDQDVLLKLVGMVRSLDAVNAPIRHMDR